MIRWMALALAGAIASATAAPPPQPATPHAPSIIDRQFYQATGDQGQKPSDLGWKYEDVHFTSADGTKLHGWFIPAPDGPKTAKGTVLYVHGITGAIGDIMGSVQWMRDPGWNVFLFDYRGYGRSEGKTSRLGIIEDTQAALQLVKTTQDIDQDKVVAMGYSLGGSTLLTAMGREKTTGIKLVVAVSSFSSYRKVIADNLGWKPSLLDNDSWAPKDFVADIAPTPIVLIHGKKDNYVPFRHAHFLHKAAKPGTGTLIPVETGTHKAPFGNDPATLIKRTLKLMEDAVR